MATPSKKVLEWSRAFVLDFIELYRECPCLWNVKSDSYKNRQAKVRAYQQMVEKTCERYPGTTLQMVKAKINTLRTQFRKELKRVVASKNSGSCDTYEPKLWFFSELQFIADEEDQPQAVGALDMTFQDGDECTTEESDSQEDEQSQNVKEESSRPAKHPGHVLPNDPSKRRCVTSAADEVLKLAMEQLKSASDAHETDEYDSFGKVIAAELRRMDRRQQCIAKKVINEAIFSGSMGFLDELSHVSNVPHLQFSPDHSSSNRLLLPTTTNSTILKTEED